MKCKEFIEINAKNNNLKKYRSISDFPEGCYLYESSDEYLAMYMLKDGKVYQVAASLTGRTIEQAEKRLLDAHKAFFS